MLGFVHLEQSYQCWLLLVLLVLFSFSFLFFFTGTAVSSTVTVTVDNMAMVMGGLFFLELKGNGTHTGNGTDCPDGNQWIMAKFDQCIVSTLQWASFFVGMSSILCWVTVLLP